MFEGLIAKLAFGALWSKAKTNAVHDWQAIPPKARLWVIGVIALIVAAVAHQLWAHHVLSHARTTSYDAGYAKAVADIQAREAKITAALKQAKTIGDAKNVAVNEGVKKVHDAQSTHIDSNLADLLGGLRERTQGGAGSNTGRSVPGAAGGAGAQRAAARADDGLAQDPAAQGAAAGDVLIAVPAKGLYVRAAQCDRDYNALTTWEDAYTGWRQTYVDWLATTKKVTEPTR